MPKEDYTCPVCGKDCKNAGGLAAHVRLSKDSDHVEHRARLERGDDNPLPTASADAEGAMPDEAAATSHDPPDGGVHTESPSGPEGASEPEASPDPDPPDPLEGKGGQEGGQDLEDTVNVAWSLPTELGPLIEDAEERSMGDDGVRFVSPMAKQRRREMIEQRREQIQQQASEHVMKKGQLEGMLAAATTQMINGFVLSGEYDEQLTVQQVGDTGFPHAAENALLHYFPELPWDHPAVLLTISGASLVSAVAAAKGKHKPAELEDDQDDEPELPSVELEDDQDDQDDQDDEPEPSIAELEDEPPTPVPITQGYRPGDMA